ncbi:pentatricopeptide repeat-containing protein At1g11290, chloroplastic-like [Punica granatum]|uniref:Uncharacterized protein n=2 Tax=Punica granatum TaxID=22663 RepID=A0A218W8H8_PUNGR|nr:pentatricopeptide repeat-containing protein At1g11290, chloroplastic-like [Punica granatum]OWM68788.1 hypothetical protein CDL15_Pgr024975 [Punica granatum]PKI35259.1 hypothetical protein CRG98_044350 [Punica granatum]
MAGKWDCHVLAAGCLKQSHGPISRSLNTLTRPCSPGGSCFSGGSQPQELTSNKYVPHPSELKLLSQLQQHGTFSADPYALNRIISSCAKSASLRMGTQVHPFVLKLGLSSNVYISSALVAMYGKCGRIWDAHDLFNEMPFRNVVTWNSLISGYIDSGSPGTGIDLFMQMLRFGVSPTPFSVSTVLMGSAQLKAKALGCQLHGLSYKLGICCNIVIGTGLIDMYSKCSILDDARRVFDWMLDKNVITWTSMVTGHAQNEQPQEAMLLAREMLQLGLRPNYVTYSSLLSSFSSQDYLNYCEQIHSRVIREGYESNPFIAVTLVTVYSECSSSLGDFWKVCAGIKRWDQIAWNAIIAGYANLGQGKEALSCFAEMRKAGVELDFFTFVSALKGARICSALKEGKQLHGLIFKMGCASLLRIQNGLVSMYAGCGMIGDAKKVFSSIKEHDVVSWNTLLSGCAHHGLENEAADVFDQLRRMNIKPDGTTFLAVLTACSHVGLVEKGVEYFEMMRNEYSIEPQVEHYATAVDLLGRAGNLHEAEALIDKMPMEPGPSVYKALLSSCQIHGDRETAERTAKKLLDRYPDDPATYILLSNVLEMGQNWVDAAETRLLMCDRGIRKSPGCSTI